MKVALFLALLVPGSAFTVHKTSLHPKQQQQQRVTTFRSVMQRQLSDIDAMCIANVAELCLQTDATIAEGCDIEQHEALLNQILDQRALLVEHAVRTQENIDKMDLLIRRLEGNGVVVPAADETYFPG
jgi:hypothetical protein